MDSRPLKATVTNICNTLVSTTRAAANGLTTRRAWESSRSLVNQRDSRRGTDSSAFRHHITPQCVSATTSPSLSLRANEIHLSITSRVPFLPVETMISPFLERHQPSSIRMMSPVLTCFTWSPHKTIPTNPVSSLPHAAAREPV